MITTALSSPGPNSRFLCRPTMEHVHGVLLEHVYGILLDEKFLYRSVHAAFVNTKWYEAWLERTLLLDPIIFDMWGPGVLSWAPGDPCNSHHARHDLFKTQSVQDTFHKTRSVQDTFHDASRARAA